MTITKNTIVIMSDEHSNKILGCHGNEIVKTPNIDRLATQGCRFSSAYTNSPICLPARAAFSTGRYVNQTGYWDNAHPYEGSYDSWGHILREKKIKTVSVGKLHYRNATDDTGFDEQILPMHIVGGKGDVLGSVRDELPRRMKCKSMADQIGPGESAYTEYDRNITRLACNWLRDNAAEEPFVLYIGFVAPHFPLIAPQEFYDLYNDQEFSLPKSYHESERPNHPWLNQWRTCWIHDEFFDEKKVKIAIKSYFGLCSFLDSNIGKVLNAIQESGIADNTQIIYTSDHGDNLGARGIWGKSTFYEESAAVPMIIKGPNIQAGAVCNTPVSLVDCSATIVKEMGADIPKDWPGRSLNSIAAEADNSERIVFSEYHAAGAISGGFMLRKGNYKYIYYVGYPSQLFNLESDPEELEDISKQEQMADIVQYFEKELRTICDPEEVDQRAKSAQENLVNANGGRSVVVEKGGFGATPPPSNNVRLNN